MIYQNQITKSEQNRQLTRVESFKALVNTKDMVRRMTTACGSKEAAGQFMASMLDLYESDNYIQSCDPSKVLMECLKAASLNLPLIKSLGYAYVVPYKSIPTFIIGYKGYIQLALRSGQYRALNADCIYEGEEIVFDRLSGRIGISGTPISNKVNGYFAYFQLVNGFEKSIYMTVDEIREHGKKYSKAYGSGPWQSEFDAMAKKTVIRKILKYGPMSTKMQEAELMEVQAEEQKAQATINLNANQEFIDVTQTQNPIEINQQTGEILEMADATHAEEMATPDF